MAEKRQLVLYYVSSNLTIDVFSPQNCWILTTHERFTTFDALEAQPDTSNRMEAVKLIDDDMKILDSIKFSMLSQYNTFTPVSYLPPVRTTS